MDAMDAIFGRRSVREYFPDAPKGETIARLLDAAVHAPSAVNAQPWSFIVIRDRALLDEISEKTKAHMMRERPVALPEGLYEKLKSPEFHLFYHAPTLILICAPDGGPWIREDCALAAQNLMLAAHALGLGSCWIGLSQNWINTKEGRQALGIPQGRVAVAPIAVGRPRAPAPPVERKPLEINWIG